MIDVVMLDKDRRELKALHDTAYDISAFLSDSEWDWHLYAEEKKLAEYLETGGHADFSCLDLSCEQGVGWAEAVRRKNADSFIMLVADAGISPMQYLKPSIMPGALLLRPFSRGQMQKTLRDALKQMLQVYEGDNRTGGFQLSQKADRKMIPYSQIRCSSTPGIRNTPFMTPSTTCRNGFPKGSSAATGALSWQNQKSKTSIFPKTISRLRTA